MADVALSEGVDYGTSNGKWASQTLVNSIGRIDVIQLNNWPSWIGVGAASVASSSSSPPPPSSSAALSSEGGGSSSDLSSIGASGWGGGGGSGTALTALAASATVDDATNGPLGRREVKSGLVALQR